MADLNIIVIPKIMDRWEDLAAGLRYDVYTINAIKQKEREDPKRCCKEFFRDWLTTNHGSKAGPKVWSTLIDIIEDHDLIEDKEREKMVEKIKKL